MEIRHLQHFVALAEEGKFTAAAARMHIVQSGISISIKEIEEELGSQLVHRTTRKVELTPSGLLFLDHARATLTALNDGIQAVRSQDGIVQGRLHIGILQSLTPYVELPSLLQSFHSTYPHVDFEARALNTESVPALVRSGFVDLSFHVIRAKEQWPGLQVVPYAQDSLVAIAARTHPLSARKAVALEVLADGNFVDLTPERSLRQTVDQIFDQLHLKRQIVYQVSDVPTMLHFVSKGLGVAIVPAALARFSPESNQISLLRISASTPLPKWKIAILTRTRPRNLKGKTTVEVFLEMLAKFPGPARDGRASKAAYSS